MSTILSKKGQISNITQNVNETCVLSVRRSCMIDIWKG